MNWHDKTNTVVSSIDGAEPITIDEAKDWAFVSGSLDDNTIDSLITTAREYCEGQTWQQVIAATLKHYRDCFPIDEIEVPIGPAISVDKIEYVDGDENTQTLASSEYDVDLFSHYARIQPIDGWPDTSNDVYNTVIITFKAGYDGSKPRLTVPGKIKQAMKLMIKHWFDNRTAVVIAGSSSVDATEVPMTANALLELESKRVPV